MKIDRRYQVDKLVSPDRNRFGLVHVDLGTDGCPLLVATNGSALVAVRVAEVTEADTASFLAPEVFAAVRKSTTAKAPLAEVVANGTAVVRGSKPGSVTVPTPDLKAKDFPDWRQVIPTTPKRAVRFGFDPKLLAKLVAAMGDPKYIAFSVETLEDGAATLDPIRVYPNGDAEAEEAVHTAVIMPVRIG